MFPVNDNEFHEYIIKTVGESGDYWSILTTESSGFGIPKPTPIDPKPGMTVRTYGPMFGFIRGVYLNGEKCYYRTPAEDREKHRLDMIEKDRQDRAKFEKNRTDHDRRIAALPECFRQRIAKFQYNNPDFRWKFESYELFCCEQAVVIADTLKTPEAIREFHAIKEWKDQMSAVPGLSDGHSGNTFGCAVTLAIDYLTKKQNVVARHGALAPLVGSEEYGCVPRK